MCDSQAWLPTHEAGKQRQPNDRHNRNRRRRAGDPVTEAFVSELMILADVHRFCTLLRIQDAGRHYLFHKAAVESGENSS